MNKATKEKKHGYIWGIFNHKCSRCGTGDMFQDKSSYKLRSLMKMNKNCPTCGQRMEIEPGFYYGTAYVSYSLTVAFSVSTFVALVGTDRVFFRRQQGVLVDGDKCNSHGRTSTLVYALLESRLVIFFC